MRQTNSAVSEAAQGMATPEPKHKGVLLGRRDFLRATSAGLIAAVTLSETSRADARSAAVASPWFPIPGIALGYWNPSAVVSGKASEERLFRGDVTAAIGMESDTCLTDAVRVTIHGRNRNARSRRAPVDVFAHFPCEGENGQEIIRFHAWSAHDMPHSVPSGPHAFTMPLYSGEMITLSVERPLSGEAQIPPQPQGEQRAQEIQYRFAKTPAAGVATLRAGVYFLAFTAPGVSAPHWSGFQYRLASEKDAPLGRQLCRRTRKGLVPVDFDYLVLSIASQT